MHRFPVALLVSMILLVAGTAVFATDCPSTSVQVTAERSTDPNFIGLYKYTVNASWSLSSTVHGVVQFALAFGEADSCPCACATDLVRFTDTAGSTSGRQRGTGTPCTTSYQGQYHCGGDASLGTSGPTLIFQAVGLDCENMTTTGKWTFYSVLSPTDSRLHEDAAILRFESSQCTADVRGALPDCRACNGVAVVRETWENFKRLYR